MYFRRAPFSPHCVTRRHNLAGEAMGHCCRSVQHMPVYNSHLSKSVTQSSNAEEDAPPPPGRDMFHLHLHLLGVAETPQMTSQPTFSIFLCSPLPSGICRTPGLSIPRCCLPTSSSVCVVFFPLSLCLARWFWPDLMNGKHDHTTAVCVCLRSSGDLHVVQLPAGSWHGLPRW